MNLSLRHKRGTGTIAYLADAARNFRPGKRLTALGGILGIMAVAAAVRWIRIDAHPLWLDEVITLHRASLSPSALIADSLAHLHYPSYFLIVSAALWLLDDSNFTLRLPSLVFGVLSVPLAYAIARRIGGPAAGLTAAALMALSPAQVMYAQEARSYALVIFLILVALWGFVRLATAAPAAAVPSGSNSGVDEMETDRRTGWLAWAGGTAGALIVLNIAVFWLAASVAGMLVLRYRLPANERRKFDRSLIIALAAVAVIWLPWLVAASPALVGTAQNGFWAPPASLSAIGDAIWAIYLFGVTDPIGFELLSDPSTLRASIIASAAAYGAWSLRRNRALVWTLVAAALLPPLLLLAASAVTPVFVPRYLVAGAPPFLVLAGCGLAAAFTVIARHRLAAAALAALFIADLSNNLRTYHTEEIKPRWDLAAERLRDSVQEQDLILFHSGFARWIVETKLNREGIQLPDEKLLTTPTAVDPNEFSGRVWVAYGRVGHSAGPDDSEIRKWLAEWGEPSRIEKIGRQVRIAVFELAPPAPQHVAPLPPQRPRGRRAHSFRS